MSKENHWPGLLWKWLSGYGLATCLLVLLGIQTWLATLEQVEVGLLATLRKYFHWRSWYVIPEINGKSLFLPLPGGYWVCALLLVNMVCGGLIRARKGWKTAGVLVSHFGIIFMIAAGGVAQLYEKRGVMFLFEGEQSDYAVSLTDPTIEAMEVDDEGIVGEIHVAREDKLSGLGEADVRRIRFPDLPFDLEISGWLGNAVVRPASAEDAKRPVIDGWTLIERPLNIQGELDAQACYARAVFADGSTGDAFILAVPPQQTGVDAYAPQVFEVDGKRYAVRMLKETIPVPYQVKLDNAESEYFPNSTRPKSFLSDIRRIDEEGNAVTVRIEMNQPMRQDGFTFFQRNMGRPQNQRQGPEFSGFEVVSNPADKWPEYSLYVVTLGLFAHFALKLGIFLFNMGGSKPANSPTS